MNVAKRLAYADPPYPGRAHLYPEGREVDHAELIAKLETYDGWALSTDEKALALVLPLCPPGTRILAWCRRNAPAQPVNPYPAWEPVLCRPARLKPVEIPSFHVGYAASGFLQVDGLTGQKTRDFCEWVFRCMGATCDDSLDDLFPGTGVVGATWEAFRRQPPLPLRPMPSRPRVGASAENQKARANEQLPGLEPRAYLPEWRYRQDAGAGDEDEPALQLNLSDGA